MKTIRHNNVELYTESFGNPSNPTIILLMGAMCSSTWWEERFCSQLVDKGFHVIRYDNRDTGKSTCYPPGKPGYVFEDLADDAVQVLDAYGIDKAVFMGLSMGGMLTQMVAIRHPERVRGLVLLSTMYFAEGAEDLPYSSDEFNTFMETIDPEKCRDDEERIDQTYRQWLATSKGSLPVDEERIMALAKLDVHHSDNYASRINHSYAQVTGDELLKIKQISLPTLIIHGTDDVVIPIAHGEALAATIPGAVFQAMKGSGHELHPQYFQTVAGWIADMHMK